MENKQNQAKDAKGAEANAEGTVEGITGRAKEVLGRVQENVGHIRENISHIREVGGAKVSEAYDKVSHTSISDVQSSVDNYVRQRPVKSLLIALAAGAVIGILLRGGKD